jgi:NitT/TauT family transport system permease protein
MSDRVLGAAASNVGALSAEDMVQLGWIPKRRASVWAGGAPTRLEVAASRILLFLVLVAGWEWVGREQPLLIGSPSRVVPQLVKWALDGTITANVGVTIVEMAVGFGLSLVVGTVVGWILARNQLVDAATRPFVDVLNTLPRFALAPLFMLWFGLGITNKIVLVFSVVVFVCMINTYSGVKSVDPEHLVLAKTLGATRGDLFWKIEVPSLLPWTIVSLRLGAAYALASAVVGEFLSGDRGLGYLVAYRASILDAVGMFAALVILACVAWIVTHGIALLEHRVLSWRK